MICYCFERHVFYTFIIDLKFQIFNDILLWQIYSPEWQLSSVFRVQILLNFSHKLIVAL